MHVGTSLCGLLIVCGLAGASRVTLGVSAERDELRRLVEQLSDDRVPTVLAEARQSGQASVGQFTAATSAPSDT